MRKSTFTDLCQVKVDLKEGDINHSSRKRIEDLKNLKDPSAVCLNSKFFQKKYRDNFDELSSDSSLPTTITDSDTNDSHESEIELIKEIRKEDAEMVDLTKITDTDFTSVETNFEDEEILDLDNRFSESRQSVDESSEDSNNEDVDNYYENSDIDEINEDDLGITSKKSSSPPPILSILKDLSEYPSITGKFQQEDFNNESLGVDNAEIFEENNNDPNNNNDLEDIQMLPSSPSRSLSPIAGCSKDFLGKYPEKCISPLVLSDDDSDSSNITVLKTPIRKQNNIHCQNHLISQPSCSKDNSYLQTQDPVIIDSELERDKSQTNYEDLLEETQIIHRFFPNVNGDMIFSMLDKYRKATNRVILVLWDLLPDDKPEPKFPMKRKINDDCCYIERKKVSSTKIDAEAMKELMLPKEKTIENSYFANDSHSTSSSSVSTFESTFPSSFTSSRSFSSTPSSLSSTPSSLSSTPSSLSSTLSSLSSTPSSFKSTTSSLSSTTSSLSSTTSSFKSTSFSSTPSSFTSTSLSSTPPSSTSIPSSSTSTHFSYTSTPSSSTSTSSSSTSQNKSSPKTSFIEKGKIITQKCLIQPPKLSYRPKSIICIGMNSRKKSSILNPAKLVITNSQIHLSNQSSASSTSNLHPTIVQLNENPSTNEQLENTENLQVDKPQIIRPDEERINEKMTNTNMKNESVSFEIKNRIVEKSSQNFTHKTDRMKIKPRKLNVHSLDTSGITSAITIHNNYRGYYTNQFLNTETVQDYRLHPVPNTRGGNIRDLYRELDHQPAYHKLREKRELADYSYQVPFTPWLPETLIEIPLSPEMILLPIHENMKADPMPPVASTSAEDHRRNEIDTPDVEEILAGTSENTSFDKDIYYKLRSIFPNVDPDFIKEKCISLSTGGQGTLSKERKIELLVEILLIDGVNHQQILDIRDEGPIDMGNKDEKYDYLLAVFPDADPTFLRDYVEKNYKNPDILDEFVQRNLEKPNYPTREDYLKKNKITEQIMQYLGEIDVKKFLEIFPDPVGHFENPSRKFNYNPMAYEFLKETFCKFRVTTISQVYRNNKYHLSLTAAKLRALLPDMKNKRNTFPLIPKDDIPLIQEMAYIRHKESIVAYLNKIRLEEEKEFNELKAKNMLIECQCCFNDECMISKCSNCENGHVFCNSCIRRGTETKMANGEHRINCFVNCDSEFGLSVLQKVLPPTSFSIILRKRQEAEVMAAGLEGLVSCPFCHFASIPPPESKVFECLNPECMKESCRLCKELNHVPLKCDEVIKADQARLMLEEKMTEALVRSCYQCHKPFFKEEGCNKMTCVCGASMCYLCCEPLQNDEKAYKHFNGQGSTFAELCPLWSDNRRINAEAVRKVAEVTEKEILKKNPNVKLNATAILPELPPKIKGPHDDIPNADQLPEHVRRVANIHR